MENSSPIQQSNHLNEKTMAIISEGILETMQHKQNHDSLKGFWHKLAFQGCKMWGLLGEDPSVALEAHR